MELHCALHLHPEGKGEGEGGKVGKMGLGREKQGMGEINVKDRLANICTKSLEDRRRSPDVCCTSRNGSIDGMGRKELSKRKVR